MIDTMKLVGIIIVKLLAVFGAIMMFGIEFKQMRRNRKLVRNSRN